MSSSTASSTTSPRFVPKKNNYTKPGEKDLHKETWFHGFLPRDDAKSLLTTPGQFLVRTSEPTKEGVLAGLQYILSVCSDQRSDQANESKFVIKHYITDVVKNSRWSLAEIGDYATLQELVANHLESGTLVVDGASVPFKSPLPRLPWELEHANIKYTKKLGCGAFGEVHKGNLTRAKGTTVECAIKVAILESLTKDQIREIMTEARIMRIFNHPNIIKCLGVAAIEQPIMIVMELATNGALDTFLTRNTLTQQEKGVMCAQAAWGLEYLHHTGFIHRDIAARNCLYGNGNVKISDFGMTRFGPEYKMNVLARVPLRWLAVETIKTKRYSYASDVWTYGILCWEIFHNAKQPFTGMRPDEVRRHVVHGGRLAFEEPIEEGFKALILTKMFAEEPSDRPSIAEVARTLEGIYHMKPSVPPPSKMAAARKKKDNTQPSFNTQPSSEDTINYSAVNSIHQNKVDRSAAVGRKGRGRTKNNSNDEEQQQGTNQRKRRGPRSGGSIGARNKPSSTDEEDEDGERKGGSDNPNVSKVSLA